MIIVLYLHNLISLDIFLVLCAENEPLLRPIYLLHAPLKSKWFRWTRVVAYRFIQRLTRLSVLIKTRCRMTPMTQSVNLWIKVGELWVPLWQQAINDIDLVTCFLSLLPMIINLLNGMICITIQMTIAPTQIKLILILTTIIVVVVISRVLRTVLKLNLHGSLPHL